MPTVASSLAFDTLDSQVTGLADQIARLNEEVGELRRRDAIATLAMQRLTEEQRLAARLQQDFLPKQMPQASGVSFHALFRPASFVSGDLYDVMRLDERHVGFYVADAVGHGMPAALLTMFMKNALVTKEVDHDSYRLLEPSQTIARLNQSLCEQHLSHATFATAAYGVIDTHTLEMRFSTAGHPNPLLVRDGDLIDLRNDGALLGIFADETFTTCCVRLRRGDRVFCFTDGVETAFTDGEPDIGVWRRELLSRVDHTVPRTIGELAERADRLRHVGHEKDDLTVIAIDVG